MFFFYTVITCFSWLLSLWNILSPNSNSGVMNWLIVLSCPLICWAVNNLHVAAVQREALIHWLCILLQQLTESSSISFQHAVSLRRITSGEAGYKLKGMGHQDISHWFLAPGWRPDLRWRSLPFTFLNCWQQCLTALRAASLNYQADHAAQNPLTHCHS